jgi:hypothetical protein
MRKAKKIKTVCVTSILLFTMLGITTTVSANGNGGDGGDPGGLTPGFWKNHLSSWVIFVPSDSLAGVFDVPPALSGHDLLDALKYKGGKGELGAARILLRAAVAGILNYEYLGIDNPEFEYPMTLNEIVSQVNSALASGDRDIMLDLKDVLDDHNNLGL